MTIKLEDIKSNIPIDDLLKLSNQFGIKRRAGSIPRYTILGVDWGKIGIKVAGKKTIVFWEKTYPLTIQGRSL